MKYQIFMQLDARGQCVYGWTADVNYVTTWLKGRFYAVTPPLAAFRVADLLERLPSQLGRQWFWQHRFRRIRAILRQAGVKGNYPQEVKVISTNSQYPPELIEQLKQLLTGRLFTRDQLVAEVARKGWPQGITEGCLEQLVFSREIESLPGIFKQKWGAWRCGRCNSQQIGFYPCQNCLARECPYCLSCQALGDMRGCDWLLARRRLNPETPLKASYQLGFSLTAGQRQAANKLLTMIKRRKHNVLIWAACGAGKTEVVFPVITDALNQGKQVLFAIPRREPLIQLAERIDNSFRGVEIAVHHGGKPPIAPGSLVLATTHQVLRFYRRFELGILDEMDAFPYQGSEMLQFGLKRALTTDGQLVEMTATPARINSHQTTITIPARHHGYPLPVPLVVRLKLAHPDQLREKPIPHQISSLFDRVNRPWLVFVPTIKAASKVAAWLGKGLACRVTFAHSRDKEARRKIEMFFRGELDVLVSTSILERGITLQGLQIMVFYCDHPLFTAAALVQMAGRVGRKAETPTGTAAFVARKVTTEMKQAIKQITTLNAQARAAGLLRRDS